MNNIQNLQQIYTNNVSSLLKTSQLEIKRFVHNIVEFEDNNKKQKEDVINRRNIRKVVNQQIQQWKKRELFSYNQASLQSLYEFMGECLQMMLRLSASVTKEEQNFDSKVSMCIKKVEKICSLLNGGGKKVKLSATPIKNFNSLIDSLKIIVNELYKQLACNQTSFFLTIMNGKTAVVKKAVFEKIAMAHYNEQEDSSSVYSDCSFNPSKGHERAITKAFNSHSLMQLLLPSQIQIMYQRLNSIKNCTIRQKLTNSLQNQFSENGKYVFSTNQKQSQTPNNIEKNLKNKTQTINQIILVQNIELEKHEITETIIKNSSQDINNNHTLNKESIISSTQQID